MRIKPKERTMYYYKMRREQIKNKKQLNQIRGELEPYIRNIIRFVSRIEHYMYGLCVYVCTVSVYAYKYYNMWTFYCVNFVF